MLTKIYGDVPREVLPHLESHHGLAILKALRAKASGLDSRLNLVECLKPNMLNDEQVRLVTLARAQ